MYKRGAKAWGQSKNKDKQTRRTKTLQNADNKI